MEQALSNLDIQRGTDSATDANQLDMSGLEFTMRVVADGLHRTAVNGVFRIIHRSAVFRGSKSFPASFGEFACTIPIAGGPREGRMSDLLIVGIRTERHYF